MNRDWNNSGTYRVDCGYIHCWWSHLAQLYFLSLYQAEKWSRNLCDQVATGQGRQVTEMTSEAMTDLAFRIKQYWWRRGSTLFEPFILDILRLLNQTLYGAKEDLSAIDLRLVLKTVVPHLSYIFHAPCSTKTAFTNVASNLQWQIYLSLHDQGFVHF